MRGQVIADDQVTPDTHASAPGIRESQLLSLNDQGVVLKHRHRTGKGKHKPKVEITNETIVMHPAVKLSPADAKAVDDVLQKNSKTLYKIDTVEHGKVTKTAGVLPEASLTAAARADASATNRAPGGANRTHQVICEAPCKNQQIPPFSTVFKSTDTVAKQRLIQELKPILEKYK